MRVNRTSREQLLSVLTRSVMVHQDVNSVPIRIGDAPMFPLVFSAMIALPLYAFVDPPRKLNMDEVICFTDNSERFLGLIRRGNGADRTAYFTAFESLRGGKCYRKLHETPLLNKEEPYFHELSRDGRFLVTLDEWEVFGTGPNTLVIYDLVRKESSAYSCKDFITGKAQDFLGNKVDYDSIEKDMKTIDAIHKHQRIPGLHWRGPDHIFNRQSTRFYPSLPEYCIKMSDRIAPIPFVVVNLLTRKVTIEPVETAVVEDADPVVQKEGEWIALEETVETSTTALPATLRWSSESKPDKLYRLSPDKEEYVRSKEMPDEDE